MRSSVLAPSSGSWRCWKQVLEAEAIRKRLLAWYQRHRRDLPWRRKRDPYAIWIAEIMLQQTRVAAAIPYFERFLARFPDLASLAAAAESEVLACWSGLGYYRRARHLHQAARQMVAQGGFPKRYDDIRALPGVGEYTAAAVASIAYGEPYAVVDGNVLRVMARLTADEGDISRSAVRRRLGAMAAHLLDAKDPGTFNQAVMELGATLCLPQQPQCPRCPWVSFCRAQAAGKAASLPVKRRKGATVELERDMLVVERDGKLLFRQRDGSEKRLAGFWELPERAELPEAVCGAKLGEFRHSITNHRYRFSVYVAALPAMPAGGAWFTRPEWEHLPLTTATRKALRLWESYCAAAQKRSPMAAARGASV